MTAEELGKIVARHEMQCLELTESFNVECIETACAFTNAAGDGGRHERMYDLMKRR